MNKSKNFQWEQNFPTIFKHTSISYLKQCKGFFDAKCGDRAAALAVIAQCVKPQIVEQLKQRFPNAVTIPVISSGNALPQAYAERIGLESNLGVKEIFAAKRKQLSGVQRLLNLPKFCGKIEKKRPYILVDDIIAQGGTIAALRRFVLENGGSVCAVTALASSAGKGGISPAKESLLLLQSRYGAKLLEFLQLNNLASDFSELTYFQTKYLLSYNHPAHLLSKLNDFHE